MVAIDHVGMLRVHLAHVVVESAFSHVIICLLEEHLAPQKRVQSGIKVG